MPQMDGTGPKGKGPRTGRGLGKCRISKKSKRPRKGQKQGMWHLS